MAIRSFADKATEKFFLTGRIASGIGWASIRGIARRKLDMLHYASTLGDLKSPPGNRLEALKGRFQGMHSVRINDQWRVVFEWVDDGPSSVKIVDYH